MQAVAEGVTKLGERGYALGEKSYGAGRQITTGVASLGLGVTKGVAQVSVGVGVTGVKTGVRIAETGVQSGVVVVKGVAGIVWGAKLFVHKVRFIPHSTERHSERETDRERDREESLWSKHGSFLTFTRSNNSVRWRSRSGRGTTSSSTS